MPHFSRLLREVGLLILTPLSSTSRFSKLDFDYSSLRGEVDVREIPTSRKEREKWGTQFTSNS